MATEWTVSAVFDTHEQAKQAAAMLVTMHPRLYTFEAKDANQIVWREDGFRYEARDVAV